MSVRSVFVVLLAIIFGSSAAVLVNMLRTGAQPSPGETVTVLTAAADISRYTTITPELLKPKAMPKAVVPANAITDVVNAIDRVVDVPIFKDEMVIDSKLAGKGSGRGLAAVIPNGMRAVTIPTPNVSTGVAGFVLPGNRVDVLLTLNDTSGSNKRDSTRAVLGDVEILAVDQQLEAPNSNKMNVKELRSVTLLVKPDDAMKLALAQSEGTLNLSLRNPQDKEKVSTLAITPADLHLSEIVEVKKPVQESDKERLEREKQQLDFEKQRFEFLERKAKFEAEQAYRNAPRIRTLRGVAYGEVRVQNGEVTESQKNEAP